MSNSSNQNVAVLKNVDGAGKIGRGNSTVANDLTATEQRINANEQAALISSGLDAIAKNQTSNLPSGKKSVIILGDSVSAGAFSGAQFYNSWPRVLGRGLNAEHDSKGYGFVNPIGIGTGETYSPEIHSVIFSGNWGKPADSKSTISGNLHQSSVVGSTIFISAPAITSKVAVWYVPRTGTGVIHVSVNGMLLRVIQAGGPVSYTKYSLIDVTPNEFGALNIEIKHESGDTIDICGVSYYGANSEPCLENFSQSGRALADLSDEVIDFVAANASTLIVALGLNDTDAAAMVSRVDRIILKCNENKTKLIVADFNWSAEKSDPIRQQLERLANGSGSTTIVNFPDHIRSDGVISDSAYRINTIGMWWDIAHPNAFGHRWIGEVIMKTMKLGIGTKSQGMKYADYQQLITLFGSMRHFDVTSADTISSVIRNGNTVLIKVNIKDGFFGIFPLGRQQIASKFGALSDVVEGLGQVVLPAVVNPSAGVVESTVEINPDGSMFIDVNTSTTQNQSFEVVYRIREK